MKTNSPTCRHPINPLIIATTAHKHEGLVIAARPSRFLPHLPVTKRLKVKVNCIMEVKYDGTMSRQAYEVAPFRVWSSGEILCKSALRQSGWSPSGQHVLDRWSHFHRWLGVTMSPWSRVMRRIPAPAQRPPTRNPRQASSSARAERASKLIFD